MRGTHAVSIIGMQKPTKAPVFSRIMGRRTRSGQIHIANKKAPRWGIFFGRDIEWNRVALRRPDVQLLNQWSRAPVSQIKETTYDGCNLHTNSGVVSGLPFGNRPSLAKLGTALRASCASSARWSNQWVRPHARFANKEATVMKDVICMQTVGLCPDCLKATGHPSQSSGPPCGRPARAVLAGRTSGFVHTPVPPIKMPPQGGQSYWRRGWDSNPRAGRPRPSDFESAPL